MKYLMLSILLFVPTKALAGPNDEHLATQARMAEQRRTFEELNFQLEQRQKAHEKLLAACRTSQCKLDESKEFRAENDKLLKEKLALKEAMRNGTVMESDEAAPAEQPSK